MLRKILGCLFLIAIACAVVTCSASLESSSQNPMPSGMSGDSEQSLVAQSTSETEPTGDSESSEVDENQDAVDEEALANADNCPITLTAETFSPVQCAKLYQIVGKIEFANNLDASGLKDISRISEFSQSSAYKSNGWFGNPEALLNEEENWIATNEAGPKLLFNTLDMVAMGENARLGFRKDAKLDGGIRRNVEQRKIRLDLGEIVVGNAVIDPISSTSAVNFDASSQLVADTQVEKADKSFFQELWHGGKNRLNRLRTALLPRGFIAQPAVASEADTSVLNAPTLRIETPEARVDSNGAVYVVKREADKQRTQVFSLSEQPIKVIDNNNEEKFVSRNQTVVVNQTGILEEPYEFKLCGFYRDNQGLLEGLAPKEVDVVRQQPHDMQFAYHAARSLTVPLYHRNCQRQCAPRGS